MKLAYINWLDEPGVTITWGGGSALPETNLQDARLYFKWRSAGYPYYPHAMTIDLGADREASVISFVGCNFVATTRNGLTGAITYAATHRIRADLNPIFGYAAPDAIVLKTNLTGSLSDITEDFRIASALHGTGLVPTSATSNTDCRVSFPAPVGKNLKVGAGLQTFGIWCTLTGSGTGGSISLDLLENGALVRTLTTVSSPVFSGSAPLFISGSWNASELAAVSGVDVELRFRGTAGAARSFGLTSAGWLAEANEAVDSGSQSIAIPLSYREMKARNTVASRVSSRFELSAPTAIHYLLIDGMVDVPDDGYYQAARLFISPVLDLGSAESLVVNFAPDQTQRDLAGDGTAWLLPGPVARRISAAYGSLAQSQVIDTILEGLDARGLDQPYLLLPDAAEGFGNRAFLAKHLPPGSEFSYAGYLGQSHRYARTFVFEER